MAITGSDSIMSDEDRIERLEEAVSLLLAIGGQVSVPEFGKLRTEVRRNAVTLATEAVARVRQRNAELTPRVQYTGRNLDAVREFVGSDATVLDENGAWIVTDGKTWPLAPGTWVTRDRDTNAVRVGEDFDIAELYAEVLR
jgi:hypothetical protein